MRVRPGACVGREEGSLAGATRGLLVAGGAGSLVEYDVLPGRAPAYDAWGLNGGSRARPGEGGARLPVVLALHPADVHPTWMLQHLRPDRFLPMLADRGLDVRDAGVLRWAR